MKKPSPTTTPITKADLTEAMDRVMAANKADLAAAMAENKTDLTQAIGQVLEGVKDTRLQLERKIDWVRQDAKEQLESVEKRLSGRMDKMDGRLGKMDGRLGEMDGRLGKMDGRLERVASGLAMTQAAVLEVARDMKEVKHTLADHGKKLDRLTEKVDEHDRAILALQDARLP